MAELLLRDLCRWDRRFTVLYPPGANEEAVLDRPVSWAVSVRAASPFLPPLRGDELVILSGRILREIQSAGLADAEELLETLAEAPVAALVTEPGLFEEPIGSLPLLLFPGPIPLDLESMLNRLLTEQRRTLYRLSTELTRDLSRAALTGGIDAVLQAATLASGRSLVLQDSEGRVLAAGGDAAAPAAPTALARARPHPSVRALNDSGDERLLTAISVSGRLVYLSLLAQGSAATERDRLVREVRELCRRHAEELPQAAQLHNLLRYAQQTPSVEEVALFFEYQASRREFRDQAPFLGDLAARARSQYAGDPRGLREFLAVVVRAAQVERQARRREGG